VSLPDDFEGDDFNGFQRITKPTRGKGGQRPTVDKEGIRQLGDQCGIITDWNLTCGLMAQGLANLKVGPRGRDSANEFARRHHALSLDLEQMTGDLAANFRKMTAEQRNGIFKSQSDQAEVVRSALKLVGITSPKLARDPR